MSTAYLQIGGTCESATASPVTPSEFETGPCKLRRVGGGHLVVSRGDSASFIPQREDRATEVPVTLLTCTDNGGSKCSYGGGKTGDAGVDDLLGGLAVGDYGFSAFNLVPDGRGMWQLRFFLTPPPSLTCDQVEGVDAGDLVLGAVAGSNEARLVERVTDGSPTPKTQVVLRRGSCAGVQGVVIERGAGTFLTWDSVLNQYVWGSKATCFVFERLLNLGDVSLVEPLSFVPHPGVSSVLVLPKMGEDTTQPQEFESALVEKVEVSPSVVNEVVEKDKEVERVPAWVWIALGVAAGSVVVGLVVWRLMIPPRESSTFVGAGMAGGAVARIDRVGDRYAEGVGKIKPRPR
jgi:hypothetical protein